MSDNNQIFLEFWRDYQWPEAVTLRFRLYHDDRGVPITYTHEDLPGAYITVTPEQFALADMGARVRDMQLVSSARSEPPKLVPSDQGTACDPSDVCVIQHPDRPAAFWRLKNT